jgi:general stress protein YciG
VLFDAVEQGTAGSAELARAATDVAERAIGPKGGAHTGGRADGDYASKVFGRSPRDANCDCSASNEPNLLQAIYMQNDKEVITAIERKGGWLDEVRSQLRSPQAAAIDIDALVREAFLRTLSRPPTAAEAQRAAAHFAAVGDPIEALQELLWALLNTREFVTNH